MREKKKVLILDATMHLYKRLRRPLVHPFISPSVPCHFQTTNMAVFEGKKSSNDFIINDAMSDDRVVVSDVPPRYLL